MGVALKGAVTLLHCLYLGEILLASFMVLLCKNSMLLQWMRSVTPSRIASTWGSSFGFGLVWPQSCSRLSPTSALGGVTGLEKTPDGGLYFVAQTVIQIVKQKAELLAC